jgi:hypothetical protein
MDPTVRLKGLTAGGEGERAVDCPRGSEIGKDLTSPKIPEILAIGHPKSTDPMVSDKTHKS